MTFLKKVKFVVNQHGPVCLGARGYGMVFQVAVDDKMAAMKVFISFL